MFKNILKALLSIILIFIVCFHAESAGKRALLIGVSDYPMHRSWSEGSWSRVHGTNDIAIIGQTLGHKGFKLTKLLNSNATAEKIRKAFGNLAKECQEGDLVYIQFSGHGQAYEDLSGDEADGWDEAIIPYDAMMQYKRGVYEGKNHILDDELEVYLSAIRAKVGKEGFVYVVLDACHMGGASRGDEQEDDEIFVRGTDKGFSPNGKKYIPKIDRRGNMKVSKRGANLGGICILEACRAYQTNAEIKENGKYYGPLSYYINKYLTQHTLTSNTSWVEQVRTMMNKDKRLIKQNMVIENGL